jgi:hypothetical protein
MRRRSVGLVARGACARHLLADVRGFSPCGAGFGRRNDNWPFILPNHLKRACVKAALPPKKKNR